ncbi:MAG TPA: papain-like cysteine protease family protein [Hyphomicrobiales bacterium]|nr:hypothetical protein [Rhodobiaceae bacterium]HXK53390.1 papain-like cysteine protease family protein [Hyphomicrobiales bacterium]
MTDIDRRHLILALAASAALAAAPGPAAAAQACRTESGVRHCFSRLQGKIQTQATQTQNRSQWCWAAALSIIFDHYGYSVSQERIVGDVWGQVTDMPRHVDGIMRDINRVWIDDKGRHFRAIGARLTLDSEELPVQAARALARNQPLIVGLPYHAVVLTEMRWRVSELGKSFVDDLIVSDPREGRKRNLTVEERLYTRFVASVDVAAR